MLDWKKIVLVYITIVEFSRTARACDLSLQSNVSKDSMTNLLTLDLFLLCTIIDSL